jgi:ribosome-associated heat shock protein Hsp15
MTARVDSWLWAVRVYRTRSAATAACKAGHVRIDGVRVKPSQQVRVGQEVRAFTEGGTRILVARELIQKRVSAAIAATCVEDLTPPPPPKEERVLVAVRERGAGRPTKRDRRELDRLQGR